MRDIIDLAHPPDWLGDPAWAKFSVIMADTWKFMPFLMLVLYAGLQAFDTALGGRDRGIEARAHLSTRDPVWVPLVSQLRLYADEVA